MAGGPLDLKGTVTIRDGGATGTLRKVQGAISAIPAAAKNATGALGNVGKSAAVNGQRTQKALQGGRTGAGGAYGAGVVGGIFLKNAYEYDKAVKMTDATADNGTMAADKHALAIERLRNKYVELAAKYPLTRRQIAEGGQEFITAGNAIDLTTASMEDLVKGAIASQQTVGKVGKDVTDVVAGYFGKIKDPEEYGRRVNQVLNMMAVGATSANHTWGEQTLAMQYSVPVARALGLSLEQLTAAIGVLADNGFKGEKGGSALRTILLNLAAPTAKARAAFVALGIEMDKAMSFNTDKAFSTDGMMAQLAQRFGAQGEDVEIAVRGVLNDEALRGNLTEMRAALLERLREVLDIDPGDLQNLKYLTAAVDAHLASAMDNLDFNYIFSKLAKASAGQLKDITGVKRTPQSISLSRGFADQYEPKLEALQKGAPGALDRRMNKFLTGFAASIDRAISALDALSDAIERSGTLDDVTNFFGGMRSIAEQMQAANPEMLRFLGTATLVVAGMSVLGFMFAGVGAAIAALVSPIGIAIGVIGALAYAIHEYFGSFEGAKKAASDTWGGFEAWWEGLKKSVHGDNYRPAKGFGPDGKPLAAGADPAARFGFAAPGAFDASSKMREAMDEFQRRSEAAQKSMADIDRKIGIGPVAPAAPAAAPTGPVDRPAPGPALDTAAQIAGFRQVEAEARSTAANVRGIMQSLDLASEGRRWAASLAAGLRSGRAEVAAAARDVANAARSATRVPLNTGPVMRGAN